MNSRKVFFFLISFLISLCVCVAKRQLFCSSLDEQEQRKLGIYYDNDEEKEKASLHDVIFCNMNSISSMENVNRFLLISYAQRENISTRHALNLFTSHKSSDYSSAQSSCQWCERMQRLWNVFLDRIFFLWWGEKCDAYLVYTWDVHIMATWEFLQVIETFDGTRCASQAAMCTQEEEVGISQNSTLLDLIYSSMSASKSLHEGEMWR